MTVAKLGVRFLALAAAVFAVMLAFGSVGQGPQQEALASTGSISGVTCSDIWLDLNGDAANGNPPTPGTDVRVGKSITRLDDTGTSGDRPVDVTTVTYLNPGISTTNPFGDKVVSDTPCVTDPTGTPVVKGDGNSLNPSVKFAPVDVNDRPTVTAQLTGKKLSWSTCEESEALGVWTRTDVDVPVDKTPGVPTFGTVTLAIDTDSGPACADNVDTLSFTSHIVSMERVATTGLPSPSDPDDWDGDNCTDFDELDPVAPSGADPFNPNDCDHNYTGVYNVLATLTAATKDTPGIYFHCISRIDHDKHAQTLDSNIVCYQDAPALADAKASGSAVPTQTDGLTGPPPPPPYGTGAPSKLTGTVDVKPQAEWSVTTPTLPATADTITVGFVPDPEHPFDQVGSVDVSGVTAPCDTPVSTTTAKGDVNGTPGDLATVQFPAKCINTGDKITVIAYHTGPTLKPPVLEHVVWDNSGAPDPTVEKGTATLVNTVQKDPTLVLEGCFENVGGALTVQAGGGANIFVHSEISGKTNKGTTQIFSGQTQNECATATPSGTPSVVTVQNSPQNISFDHDGDGCTDWQELGHDKDPATTKKCGDDPYNPFDSDGDFNGSAHVLVTASKADTGAGSYFHCAANIVHNTTTNDLTLTPMCYIDSPLLDVNTQDRPGVKGDGYPNAPPPGWTATTTGKTPVLGDVDDPHTSLDGTYDKVDNEIQLAGCFQNVEGPLGPNVYVQSVGGAAGNSVADHIDAHTGQGVVDIFTAEDETDCKSGASGGGTPEIPGAAIELAEQGVGFDTDQDGCTDAQELQSGAGTIGSGGLRDPFNYWDFRDVPAGTPPARDGAVFGGDIAAVVSVFGEDQADSPADANDDPVLTPITPGLYHPAYDVSGSLSGSSGAHNTKGPDGGIFGTDISAIVAQFGDSC